MPERFGLPDQPSPGAHLLPLPQPVLDGMATTVDENGHGFTLLWRQPNKPNHPSRFGVLKQKSICSKGPGSGSAAFRTRFNDLNRKIEALDLPLAQAARPGPFHRIVPSESCLPGEMAVVVRHPCSHQLTGLKAVQQHRLQVVATGEHLREVVAIGQRPMG